MIGQNYAKKILSVAVYKHYNRINHNAKRRAKDEKGKNIKKTQSEYWSTEVTTNGTTIVYYLLYSYSIIQNQII